MRRLAGRAAMLAALPILIVGLTAGTAAAASGGGQVITYPGTSASPINEPFAITAGPDGEQALWFTNQGGEPDSTGGSIGEITTPATGTVTVSNWPGTSTYPIDDPAGITAWNGALWFTNQAGGPDGSGSIGEMNTSGTVINEITGNTSNGIDDPEGITVGPDGNLWFTNTGNNTIGAITTSGTVYNYAGAGIDDPTSITAAPDGEQALWFTNSENDTIGELTITGTGTGTVSNWPLNGSGGPYQLDGPFGIAAWNGALWFTYVAGGPSGSGTGGIGEMNTSGKVIYTNISGANPTGITVGPDGALWFTNSGNGTGTTIGRLNSSGTVSSYPGTSTYPIDGPEWITPGPDGALWFTNYSGNSIGRITPPAPQTITFTSTPPSPAVYGGSYTPEATASSGLLPVTFSIDPASTAGACKINGSGVVSFTGVGTCVIDANQVGNADWLPAPQAQQPVTIGQAPQTITFTSTPPVSPAFGSTYTVSATGGASGNPVTFGISSEGLGPCVISGSTVTFIGAGNCIINASQAGNADYQAAGEIDQVVTVPQEAPVLTWAKPGTITLGTPLTSIELDATASAAGTFSYNPPAGTVLSLGTHTLTATFTPANTTNYTSGTVSTTITVLLPCLTCK